MNSYPAYISIHNSDHVNKIIVLMTPNGGQLYYLAVKKLAALFRGITSKHDDYFYCLNCLYLFRTKGKPESQRTVYENE